MGPFSWHSGRQQAGGRRGPNMQGTPKINVAGLLERPPGFSPQPGRRDCKIRAKETPLHSRTPGSAFANVGSNQHIRPEISRVGRTHEETKTRKMWKKGRM